MGMFDEIRVKGKILPMEERVLFPDPNDSLYQTKDMYPDINGKLDTYTLTINEEGKFILLNPDGDLATHVNCKHLRFYAYVKDAFGRYVTYEFVGEIKNGIFTCLHFCEGN